MTLSNMDAALHGLTDELSVLVSEVKVLNEQIAVADGLRKSKQVEIGYKLIAIREILRAEYGVSYRAASSLDATGKPAPLGWNKWVNDNLPISVSHAHRCIRFAVDPEGLHAQRVAEARKQRGVTSAGLAMRTRMMWPKLTPEERENFRRLVVTLSKELL